MSDPTTFTVEHDGVLLDGEEAGTGSPVLLLHGLTATRRYVVHGSRAVERAGHRVVSYDARGHGVSSPAPDPAHYTYDRMIADAVAVLDALGIKRAAVVGQSMGSATALGLALRHPERVSALVVITPAHRGRPSSPQALERWDRLAAAFEAGGPEGFVGALNFSMDERFRDTVRTVVAQRMARHEHRAAIVDCLRMIPRSAAFDGLDALAGVRAPTLLVGSRDSSDPDHPLAVAQEYERRIPDVRLVVEDEGQSPLAWRGGTLSKEIIAHIDAA